MIGVHQAVDQQEDERLWLRRRFHTLCQSAAIMGADLAAR
jgi:hypothetical protein